MAEQGLISGATARALTRRVTRFLWMLVFFASKAGVDSLALWTKYVSFLRKEIRRGLVKPLQHVSAHAGTKFRNLPPAKHATVSSMDVVTEASDGVKLYGTIYTPLPARDDDREARPDFSSGKTFSTILVRTPYGRFNLGPEWAKVFAERGFVVLVQDTRGRFGSGGDFFPVKHEIQDGGDTIDWIREQPWSNGKVSLWGISYLGLTAYAAAGSKAGRHISCIVPIMTGARAFSIIFHRNSGSLALDLVLRWLWLAVKLMDTPRVIQFWFPPLQGELNRSFMDAPLASQDEKLIGMRLGFLQDAIRATDIEHEFWSDKDMLCDMSHPERPPTHIIGGWYDFFLKQSFEDFERGASKGERVCRMTVGTWKHWHFANYGSVSLNVALDMFQRHMEDDAEKQEDEKTESAIHVAILGTSPTRWCSFASWPPQVANESAWPLSRMTTRAPVVEAQKGSSETAAYSHHIYNPENPTPYCGGPSFDPLNSGRVEQSSLEARDDVLVFSSRPLRQDMYVCGDVFVEIHARSSNPHTDFFFKLCEVVPSQWFVSPKSYNLAEDLARFGPDDWDETSTDANGVVWYELKGRRIKLGPIATRYAEGTRIRLQVSGGAHPLYMRNFGTDHEIAEAVETCSAEHRIFHDTQLVLPIVDKTDIDRHTDLHPAFPNHVAEHD
ncbi:Hypothetical Protein FCC1311_096982 [Hondaea fermentalgiana]|uniref:Xaa-Pro dipeptidyl-peptidase C-terminal domain-containing protein n=1 Tax=Hondaea fermentalgiana TaxID=2315210 RepID=A0A2R5GSA6_9STRA|nr:Hypothetical Protein FCC1311_096982 [Hondaea fermentalgiana]|eukprot:GBG33475.1 Hypothetical Protein FCC1311_096982 [Hondaea fermentalgiana]